MQFWGFRKTNKLVAGQEAQPKLGAAASVGQVPGVGLGKRWRPMYWGIRHRRYIVSDDSRARF